MSDIDNINNKLDKIYRQGEDIKRMVRSLQPTKGTKIGDVEMNATDPAMQKRINLLAYLTNTNKKDYAWLKALSDRVGNEGEVFVLGAESLSRLIDAVHDELKIPKKPFNPQGQNPPRDPVHEDKGDGKDIPF